ncbi:alcohol dehydrogenase catalytic domain-containing protein [Allosaccharopolyspora coralli]|uniref:Alcohol dehydrogenase catalytic domain-containing protein n=1 Tax=Allosaccharopolyspora coralli TaxID=2665642 RepID=A0A5Q3QB28_9PSEU|nr:glucose 1-dehydrogenase [Allosaccharopolyspora coralli]QGK71768.1 alcohol dehydrogenase catalytic domain-containing protein [Allosaccharopolyspora coralli]
MRAATVVPGDPDSAGVSELPGPTPQPGELLVEGLLAGMCATDREVAASTHGVLPPGHDRLVLFHESVGRVLHAPAISGFHEGDFVAGVVRRPDPKPCGACAAGEWDFCLNGEFTERGIKGLDGFGAQRWTVEPRFAIPVPAALGELGVLTEPTSVVAKAWEQVELIGRRSFFAPRRVLVTGAGPIGLLAALLAVQQGLEVHVLDRVDDGPKPDLVAELGATYHRDVMAIGFEPDVVVEATGSGEVVFEVLQRTARNAITVLTGISGGDRTVPIPAGAINNELVLDNDVVVGSVNANLRHYRSAVQALAAADPEWLSSLITRRLPLDKWPDGFSGGPHDIKTVVELQ